MPRDPPVTIATRPAGDPSSGMFMARVWTAAHPFEPGYSRAHHRPYRYRMAAPRTLAFSGRARERQVLDRLLDRVRGGEGAVVVRPGAAGGGKASTRCLFVAQAS